jgi:hypothetical protein
MPTFDGNAHKSKKIQNLAKRLGGEIVNINYRHKNYRFVGIDIKLNGLSVIVLEPKALGCNWLMKSMAGTDYCRNLSQAVKIINTFLDTKK